MPVKILVMGLPGSGKTYFAERLKKYLEDFSNVIHMPFRTAPNILESQS
jgi:adenylate kinase family enzyme